MLIALAAHLALAAGVSAHDVEAALSPKLAGLVDTYKQFHAAPELSEKEDKTSQKIAARLKQLGYKVTEHVGVYDDPKAPVYGLVAILKNGDGPQVLMRADMDGLPVTEESGVPYASKARGKNSVGADVGVMHACGHDIHMTSLLGTAELMTAMKDKWHGTLMLIAQPSEEVGTGARSMLSAGLYEKFGKPKYAIGMHVDSQLPAGLISTKPEYIMANVDEIDITMRGVGGHGAYPHRAKDPIVMSAEFIQAIQTLVSRETQPGEAAVVTVGSIHAGTKHNIIPEEVKMQLTVRSFRDDVRKNILDGLRRVASGIATAAGVPQDRMPIVTELEREFTPSTYNNPELTTRLMGLWKEQMGDSNVIMREAQMGGEDFSRYSLPDHSIPATFFFVGGTDPKVIENSKKTGKPIPMAHSSTFVPLPDVTLRASITATVVALTSLLQ
jgi:amidohydrolase